VQFLSSSSTLQGVGQLQIDTTSFVGTEEYIAPEVPFPRRSGEELLGVGMRKRKALGRVIRENVITEDSLPLLYWQPHLLAKLCPCSFGRR
jgi:hypothetical protein